MSRSKSVILSAKFMADIFRSNDLENKWDITYSRLLKEERLNIDYYAPYKTIQFATITIFGLKDGEQIFQFSSSNIDLELRELFKFLEKTYFNIIEP